MSKMTDDELLAESDRLMATPEARICRAIGSATLLIDEAFKANGKPGIPSTLLEALQAAEQPFSAPQEELMRLAEARNGLNS